jgi:hypothetical protein
MPRGTCRFVSLADVLRRDSNVRFTPKSGQTPVCEMHFSLIQINAPALT